MCTIAIKLGQFAEKWIKNSGGEIRRGMVLVDTKSKPSATYTFTAELWTFDGSTKTIKNNAQPIVHIVHIRQAAKVMLNTKKEDTKSIDDIHKSNPTSSDGETQKSSQSPTDKDSLSKKQLQKYSNRNNKSHQNLSQCQEEVVISPNKKTILTFQFLYNPEYVTKDSYLIINDNNFKAFGRIIDVNYDLEGDKFGLS